MKSKGRFINYIGILFGIISLGIIIFSFLYFFHIKPLHRLGWHDFVPWEQVPGEQVPWERIEGEKRVEGEFINLEVKNFSGSIEIKSWDRDYTHVQYSKRGPSSDDIEVKMKTEGKVLSIHPEYLSGRKKPFGSVSFDITIPKGIKNISAESVSGSIELSNMSPEINQKLKTVSGSIETDNSKDLNATTISGSIDFLFSGSVLYAKTISGRIRGDILDIAHQGSLDLSSVSGSIHLNAYRDFNADVKLKSTSGSVSCDFPIIVNYQKRNHLEGTIGEGLTPVNINTTSGSIRIEKL